MQIICAWCHKPLGEKEPLWDKRTTHGICEPCKGDLLARAAKCAEEQFNEAATDYEDEALAGEEARRIEFNTTRGCK